MSKEKRIYLMGILTIIFIIGWNVFYFSSKFQLLPLYILDILIIIITIISPAPLFLIIEIIYDEQQRKFSKKISTLCDNGDYDEAIEICNIALEKNPKRLSILENLNKLFVESGQYDKSIEINQNFLNLAPKKAKIWFYNIAYAYYKRGDYDKALESLNKILKIDSTNASAIKLRDKILNEKE